MAKLSPAADAILWSTFLGADDEDGTWGLELDIAGSPVISGASRSIDFPTTIGAYDETHNSPGMEDITVTKLDGATGQISWSTFIGGDDREHPHHLVLDTSGAPILGGWTSSADFPVTPDAFSQNLSSPIDAWIARLDAGGSHLSYNTYFGGNDEETVNLMAVNAQSEIVFTGWTKSTDFPVTFGVWDTTPNGYSDAIVSCFSVPLPAEVNTDSRVPTRIELTGSPNPMRSDLDLAFRLPEAAPTSLRILSPDGRVVRHLVSALCMAGPHTIYWDGIDDTGRPAASGIYFIALHAGGNETVERVALLR